MLQFFKGLFALLMLCSLGASAQYNYKRVVNVKLDNKTYAPASKIEGIENGTIDVRGDSIVINKTVFKFVRTEQLVSSTNITYTHLLLTAPYSSLHRLYSCVLSYKAGKLYLAEIWRGDLTCKYYIVNTEDDSYSKIK